MDLTELTKLEYESLSIKRVNKLRTEYQLKLREMEDARHDRRMGHSVKYYKTETDKTFYLVGKESD